MKIKLNKGDKAALRKALEAVTTYSRPCLGIQELESLLSILDKL